MSYIYYFVRNHKIFCLIVTSLILNINNVYASLTDNEKSLIVRINTLESKLYDLNEKINLLEQKIVDHEKVENIGSDLQQKANEIPIIKDFKQKDDIEKKEYSKPKESNDYYKDNLGINDDIKNDLDNKTNKSDSRQNEKQDYDIAFMKLNNKKFEEAEHAFAEFLDDYPESSYKPNAIFWYAETFFHREMFREAAANYIKCYKEYPNNVKAPDALLKLAKSLNMLNHDIEACKVLDTLDKKYPERPIESITESNAARINFNCKK